jgi:hypothetical protein
MKKMIDSAPFFIEFENAKKATKKKLDELNKSRGVLLSNDFELIGKAYQIHIGNYNELKKHLTKYFSINYAFKFWSLSYESKREPFKSELIRLIHNFL